MARWARVSRLAVFSAFVLGGCLVSFEDYPVDDGGPAGGRAGAVATGGVSGSGAAASGGSAAVDASVGGSSAGGSLGNAGSAGTTSGAGGMPSDAGVDGLGDAGSPCGDTMSSKVNCGRCGHDCCGGECVGGKCQPDVIYEGADGGNEAPEEIAVSGANVYFSSTRLPGVMKVLGGNREMFWNKRQRVTSVAADATGIYVAGTNDDAGPSGLVERVPLAGGPDELILDGDDYPSEIALDETHVYWRSGNSVIKRWPKNGNRIAGPVGDSISGLGRIAAANGFVYYHQLSGGRIVQRDGQGVDRQLAIDEAGVSSVAANRAYVFWFLADAGKIRRVGVAGSTVIDLANTGANPTWSAADDSHVYWITFGASGALRAAVAEVPGAAEGPLDAIDLATGLDQPKKLALDARCVYVTTAGVPGKILRIAKP